MKILAISTVTLGKNGITNVMWNLIKACSSEDMIFDVAAPRVGDSSYVEELKSLGGRVFPLPRSAKNPAAYVGALKSLIAENGYDAVHIHSNSHTCAYELVGAKLGKCPVRIVHAHSTGCKHKVLHKTLTPVFNSLCTHRLACSQKAGEFMHGSHPFTVIKNGVDTKKYAFCESDRSVVRDRLRIPAGATLLCHVGAFTKEKNQDLLMDIMASLLEKRDDFYLVCLGDGALREQTEQKAQVLGINGRVIFAGNTDNVPSYLSASDLILMPSLFEGLPLTLVEEQANGLCCLVSDRITREADLTGNLTYLPIDKGSEPWVRAILEGNYRYNRHLMSLRAEQKIIESGYSAQIQAKELRRIYESAVKVQ